MQLFEGAVDGSREVESKFTSSSHPERGRHHALTGKAAPVRHPLVFSCVWRFPTRSWLSSLACFPDTVGPKGRPAVISLSVSFLGLFKTQRVLCRRCRGTAVISAAPLPPAERHRGNMDRGGVLWPPVSRATPVSLYCIFPIQFQSLGAPPHELSHY